MLEMLDVGVEKIIAYRLGGKITEEEMTSVLDIFREKIDKGEKLIVYHFSHFSKIAVITHSKWIHKIVDLEDKIFKNVEMKVFSIEDKDKAIEFLKNE